MNNLIYGIFCLSFFIGSCQKNKISSSEDEQQVQQNVESTTPNCISDKIEEFKSTFQSSSAMAQIFSFTSEKQTYYFFDEGMAVDRPAYILNEECDTICKAGGFRRGLTSPEQNCPPEDEGSRVQIWTK